MAKRYTVNNYVRLSLKPDEAYFLLSFLDNQNLTRKEWQELDSIRSKLYSAVSKLKVNPKLPHDLIYSDGVVVLDGKDIIISE